MKTISKLLITPVLLIAISCGTDKTEVVDNRPVVAVKVGTPSSENETFITASGKIEAIQNANISTRIMGYVNTIHVKVGQKVTKGHLLLSIHSSDITAKKAQITASITEATAALKNVKKDYNRFKSLFEDHSASQKEMDDITANYEMAKARLEVANQMKNQVNAQLSYSNIKAPFSGIITGKFINEGAMANPGMTLLSLETPDKYQVVAPVPESEITHIKTGINVDVLIKSSHEIVKGKVAEVSISAKNTGGQYLVKIILDKTDIKLLSGMYTSVQFPVEKSIKMAMVLIPTSALVKRGELTGVYVVSQQNTALLRWLRLGKEYGSQIEILSGLSSNEKFIISAESKLVNGSKLQIQ